MLEVLYMKHLKQRRTPFKIISICILIAVLIIAGYLSFIYLSNSGGDSSVTQNKPTPDQEKAGNIAKSNTLNSNKETQTSSDTPPAPTPQVDGVSIVEVLMTTPQNNASYSQSDTIAFRFSISAKVTTGICTLTLKNTTTGISVVRAASTFAGPSTSTCQGFDILASDLSVGSWTVILDYENSDLRGQTTGNITIR
jgi:hypothetical protein